MRLTCRLVSGTLLTASAAIMFAVIDTTASYWVSGFPATVVVVFGADFVYASGTIFIAKITPPHERSVAGALFQTVTQASNIKRTDTVLF